MGKNIFSLISVVLIGPLSLLLLLSLAKKFYMLCMLNSVVSTLTFERFGELKVLLLLSLFLVYVDIKTSYKDLSEHLCRHFDS